MASETWASARLSSKRSAFSAASRVLGIVLASTFPGRVDEALAESDCVRQLDPMSLIIANDCGPNLYYARQYVHAIEQCEAVLKMDPGASDNFGNVRNFIFLSEIEQGKFPQPIEE